MARAGFITLLICVACAHASAYGPSFPVSTEPVADNAEALASELNPTPSPVSVPATESLPLGPGSAGGTPATSGRTPSAENTGVSPSSGIAELLRVGGALIVVIATIMGGAAVWKRIASKSGGLAGAMGPGGRAPSGVLEVLGRYPVGSGQTLVLLRMDKRVLLLAQCKGARGAITLSTLAELNEPDEVASLLLKTRDEEDTRVAARFEELLRGEDRSHGPVDVSPNVPTRTPEGVTREPNAVGSLRSRLQGLRDGGIVA
ncbi:MAG: flagellar biosynthetic protein FliO [Planctomycetota bacterium]